MLVSKPECDGAMYTLLLSSEANDALDVLPPRPRVASPQLDFGYVGL
jgi:hypothetical protein